jgi:hypothetical protein
MSAISNENALRVTTKVDGLAWNAALRECNGTVFHTAEWARYVQAEQSGAGPEFFTLVDRDGSISGLALGFHRTSSRSIATPFTGRRWLDALPVVKGNLAATVSGFLGQLEGHARRAGDVSLRIGSYASPGSEAILSPLGFSISRRLEFELDLTKDEKSLWEAMDSMRRRNIKKAMKAGVKIKEISADEGIPHLRRLQQASIERRVRRGATSALHTSDRQRDPIEILVNAGLGRIVGGFVDGICVSASLFTTFNGLAYDALLGHDSKAFETQAPSLLIWEMIQRFKAEGMERFSFGGCPADAEDESSPEHGVYKYKKAFGGTVLDCGSGEKVLRPAVLRAANLLRGALRGSPSDES